MEKMITPIVFSLFIIFLITLIRRIVGHPRDWFLTAVLSVWFPSLGHVYDMLAEKVVRSDGTFVVKGSVFGQDEIIFTSNPSNLHHIMSTNFWNYPKGPLMRSIFDVYGEMLFTEDHNQWKSHRKVTNGYFYDQRLHHYSQKVNRQIIEEGIYMHHLLYSILIFCHYFFFLVLLLYFLISLKYFLLIFPTGLFPFLDDSSEKGLVFDLQDVFQRAMLDSTCMTATGKNHGSLRIGLPYDATLDAINVANYQIFMRHILPERVWKFQRWLGIWGEKKMKEA